MTKTTELLKTNPRVARPAAARGARARAHELKHTGHGSPHTRLTPRSSSAFNAVARALPRIEVRPPRAEAC